LIVSVTADYTARAKTPRKHEEEGAALTRSKSNQSEKFFSLTLLCFFFCDDGEFNDDLANRKKSVCERENEGWIEKSLFTIAQE
jgi:hypothetical protein